jgi:hypothetical protein
MIERDEHRTQRKVEKVKNSRLRTSLDIELVPATWKEIYHNFVRNEVSSKKSTNFVDIMKRIYLKKLISVVFLG